MSDHIYAVNFLNFLFFQSFCSQPLYSLQIFYSTSLSNQHILLFSIECCSNNSVKECLFSIIQIVFKAKSTYEKSLCLFGSNSAKNIYTGFCRPCLNISILRCMELSKRYLRHCILPFLWTFRTFKKFPKWFQKSGEDGVSSLYHRNSFHLFTMIFHIPLRLRPSLHYF